MKFGNRKQPLGQLIEPSIRVACLTYQFGFHKHIDKRLPSEARRIQVRTMWKKYLSSFRQISGHSGRHPGSRDVSGVPRPLPLCPSNQAGCTLWCNGSGEPKKVQLC